MLEWMPFELRPFPSPQIDPWSDPSKLKAWGTYITPTAKKWGVDMKLPRVSPHPYTHLAHEGFQFAKEHEKGTEYNHRVFTTFYKDEQNIGDIDLLTKIAGEVGLNEEEFREALVTRKYREIHQNALKHAYEEANIRSIPTFFIGDERIQGATGKETFERVIHQELQKQKENDLPMGLACDMENGKC